MTVRKSIDIPIVEQGSNRVVGGFCSTLDAVSAAELEALSQLKRLRAEAEQVKQQLQTQSGEERERLTRRLETLRQEAAVWRSRREQATLEKHLALGHVTLSVQSL